MLRENADDVAGKRRRCCRHGDDVAVASPRRALVRAWKRSLARASSAMEPEARKPPCDIAVREAAPADARRSAGQGRKMTRGGLCWRYLGPGQSSRCRKSEIHSFPEYIWM
jgi:hypothetical protein